MFKMEGRHLVKCRNLTLKELEELSQKQVIWVSAHDSTQEGIKRVTVINYPGYCLCRDEWAFIRYDLKNRAGFYCTASHCWEGHWHTKKGNWVK
ncbi:hypothetical protein CO134_01035 [Candidatus Kuenenbacteria bacterium CG_4_9_14_3_um_filter_39_14]|nr:MAG: hypothetical protein COW86_00445 [Candidatus Kuenenbacteria bacterium CG22_combo_CG10-13_8_21_14_all_39_9]PJA92262.1 MAG: hypothetical protein CO134_01035 [Candidatus Kuenenbacteria bacterium CG_4_9_14_3_um_filter_39_14]